jgi:hypothetical protein
MEKCSTTARGVFRRSYASTRQQRLRVPQHACRRASYDDTWRNVLRDHTRRRNHRSRANAHRTENCRVRTNEYVVLNLRMTVARSMTRTSQRDASG